MGNMSYCRFRNTLEDLRDCYNYIDETIDNEEEEYAREKLIKLCAKIADNYSE
jgi:hypothetical protein